MNKPPYDPRTNNSIFTNWARDEQILKMMRKAGLKLPADPARFIIPSFERDFCGK